MDYKLYLKPTILFPVFLGIIIGLVLFITGALDDSPGLSAIGLILGTGVIFVGVNNMRKINKNIKINAIIPLFYGIPGFIGVVVLFFDNEFKDFPQFLFIGLSLCSVLIVIGMIVLEKQYDNTMVPATKFKLVRFIKLIFNIVYLIGAICVLSLSIVIVFGSEELPNPDAMVSMKISAFIWLIFGTLPMILSCIAVYFFNNIKKSKHKIRNTILIFIPGFICLCFFLLIMFAGIIHNPVLSIPAK